jgi:hypothetical protein
MLWFSPSSAPEDDHRRVSAHREASAVFKRLFASLVLLLIPRLAAAQGNIAITGHDDDFHQSANAAAQTRAMITFAKAHAPNPALPVLTFDHGAELTGFLTSLGIVFTNVDPDVGVPSAALFNTATFSAMAVASDSSCGGCDNTTTSIANLTARSAAIQAFLNAGGGIVAFSGAANAATYYGFLPSSASGSGSPPSSGFTQTAFGASISIPAVNGDATHNFFNVPGTGGVSAAYGAVEILPSAPNPNQQIVTLACQACSASGGTIIPTMPFWMALVLAVMLMGLVSVGLRRRALRHS